MERWRIGMDIHVSAIKAVAAQYSQGDWQLTHWWDIPFNKIDFCLEQFIASSHLLKLMQDWRSSLPTHISLRIAVPSHLIHLLTLVSSYSPLSLNVITWCLTEKIKKSVIPEKFTDFVFDYQRDHVNHNQYHIIIACRNYINNLILCLKQVNLIPDLIDIEANVLRCLAKCLNVPSDYALIHDKGCYLYWVAPWQTSFQFKIVDLRQRVALHQCLLAAKSDYLATMQKDEINISYLAEYRVSMDSTFHPFPLLTTLPHAFTSFPQKPEQFLIAAGLVLR